jgi:anti-sigma B factor antagonist
VKIEIRTVGDVRILDCAGKITLGEGTISIRSTVRDLLQNGVRHFVLNLGDVSYIDSAGVGELVSTYATVANHGGQLLLLNLTKRVRKLLVITKLLTVFDEIDTESAIRLRFGM